MVWVERISGKQLFLGRCRIHVPKQPQVCCYTLYLTVKVFEIGCLSEGIVTMNILSCLYWVDSEAKRFMDKQGLYSATYVVDDTRSMTEYIGLKTACLHYVVLGKLLVSTFTNAGFCGCQAYICRCYDAATSIIMLLSRMRCMLV